VPANINLATGIWLSMVFQPWIFIQ